MDETFEEKPVDFNKTIINIKEPLFGAKLKPKVMARVDQSASDSDSDSYDPFSSRSKEAKNPRLL